MKAQVYIIICLLWVTGVTCQYEDDWKCKYANGVCGETGSCNGQVWPNMCPFDKPYCCIVNSTAEDDNGFKCIAANGTCITSFTCVNGKVLRNMCPFNSRYCCIKDADVTDARCTLIGGYCATKTSVHCDGTYWPSLCGRSSTRECCVKKGFPPNDDLKCKNAHGVCGETKSCNGRIWPNMCPLDKPHCCIVNSTAEDVYCIKIGGYCFETENKCDGFPKPSLCARPNSRLCCVKEDSWIWKESKCIVAKGTCSYSTICDNGRVWPNMCPGRSRYCCIKDADVTDVDCTLMGGYCATKTDTPCDGTYWPSLCGRSTTRECCVKNGSPPSNDKICTNSNGTCVATTKCGKGLPWPNMCPVDKPHCCVKSSHRRDIHCIENGGYCVRSNGNCDGKLWPSLCGDETLGCCIKGSISTDIDCIERGGYCLSELSSIICNEKVVELCKADKICCIAVSAGKGDELCRKNGGACRDVSVKCRDGKYVNGKCADEPERKCCVLDKNADVKTDPGGTDLQLKMWTEWKMHEREDQRNILFRVQGIVTNNCTTLLGELCFTPIDFEARLEECDLGVNKSLCGKWGEWSECSSSCGKGTKTRKRQCNKSCCKPATKMHERSQKESCPSVTRTRKMPPDRETFTNSDRRPSAMAIGVVGIICIIVPAVLIISLDVISFMANGIMKKENERLRAQKQQTVKSSQLSSV